MKIIDAQNLILGRMATYVAKQALLGEEIRIINAEKAVISGDKARTLSDLEQRRSRGTPAKGPHIPKMADRYVRRVIRGMLPYKITKGDVAYKRVLCYVGVPEEFKDKKAETVEGASVSKLPTLKYMTVAEALR